MSKSNMAPVTKEKSCLKNDVSETCDLPYVKDCSKGIIDVFNKMDGTAKSLLPMAMRVGELLTMIKQKLSDVEFTYWIEENFSFPPRTAQHFMKLFRNKDKIGLEKISILRSSNNLVSFPRINSSRAGSSDEERSFLTLSLYDEEREWIEMALKKAKRLLETEFNSRAIQLILYDWLMWSMDQKQILPLEDAKKALEKIYKVKVTIKSKTRS